MVNPFAKHMLHLTLRQLKVFEAVARLRSFSRAAEALHLSQPAVSMQVRQLEDGVGLPLFEQLGKKIFLTEAGQEMFHYSRSIAAQLDEMEGVLSRMKGLEQGRLKITVVSTANYFAPQLLASFCQRHAGVSINLDVTNREVLLQQLANNETDMAIMGQPPEGRDLSTDSFMDNPLVVIAPPHHALAGQVRIPVRRLAEESFLVREPGSGTRGAMERFFREHGIEPRTGMVMSTNEAIKQAVQAGMGLGIVSLHTVALELETRRLVILDVESFPIARHWFVVHRLNKRLSPAAAGFKDFLLHDAAQLMAQHQASAPSSSPSS